MEIWKVDVAQDVAEKLLHEFDISDVEFQSAYIEICGYAVHVTEDVSVGHAFVVPHTPSIEN